MASDWGDGDKPRVASGDAWAMICDAVGIHYVQVRAGGCRWQDDRMQPARLTDMLDVVYLIGLSAKSNGCIAETAVDPDIF